jgi:hypothetical protein
MFGEGSGATIGILASAVDPRIKALDAMDPWGDWPTWLAKSPFVPEEERPQYVTEEFQKKAAMVDPVNSLPKIQAKNFRLQYAAFNPTTPASSQEKLRAAAPAGADIEVYKSPKDFVAIMDHNKVMDWMHAQLRPLPPQKEAEMASGKP